MEVVAGGRTEDFVCKITGDDDKAPISQASLGLQVYFFASKSAVAKQQIVPVTQFVAPFGQVPH